MAEHKELETMSMARNDHTCVHELRVDALRNEFEKNTGRKVLLLMGQYPFLFIGEILEVVQDYIRVAVDTTQIAQLENRVWLLHIDTISAFYIEKPGQPLIPKLS